MNPERKKKIRAQMHAKKQEMLLGRLTNGDSAISKCACGKLFVNTPSNPLAKPREACVKCPLKDKRKEIYIERHDIYLPGRF